MAILSWLRNHFDRELVSLELDDIQGLILRARPEPYVGIHAMVRFDTPEGGRDLLKRLVPHITSAAGWEEELDAWIGAGISYAGLQALGLPEETLTTFPLPFQQGMAARAEQLRDFGENAPDQWEEIFTPGTCHLALTIFAVDEPALQHVSEGAMAELEQVNGVTLLGTHAFAADEDAKNPFGYRDSISQPAIAGTGVREHPGQKRLLAAGEFILGENSETGTPLAMPDPPDLGRNGSFVVFRKYRSRPGAFNDYVRSHTNTEDEAALLGAKMFGRWQSGAPLVLAPDADDPELGADPERNNSFDYEEDPHGFMCPYGSHARRLNPRDSPLTILTDVNIHRIIRRSSTFGPRWDPERTTADDETTETGIYFIFISARAYDTIEFLQQEWINRGNFIDLAEERDPIVGLHEEPGEFTIPADPVRSRVSGVTTFNQLRGGEYLFMPSITALNWLGDAGWEASTSEPAAAQA